MTTDDASRPPEEGSAAGEMFALPETQRDRDWLAWQQELHRRIMAVFALPSALLEPPPEREEQIRLYRQWRIWFDYFVSEHDITFEGTSPDETEGKELRNELCGESSVSWRQGAHRSL